MTSQRTAVTGALVCYTKIAGALYTAYGHGDHQRCDPLGAIVGSPIGARWRPSRTLLTAALLPAFVAAPMLLMGSGAPWLAIAAAALLPGVLQAVYYVLWTTILQKNLAPEVLVRVNSWNMVAGYALNHALSWRAQVRSAEAGAGCDDVAIEV
ncbi:MFS transporter [Actinomadura rayongensis]|uniref:Uncharacterized protein n=1 Tax=Actinomadura rayongensis TaxID=1429076 RepID=A0A6I4W698_9ACTN|nr:MFS transporter [Actinomadura rayongensis]MXQ65697.1 hypothetical protein [Actinomadura rayongensis]